jgi:hypothetical protein
MYSYIGPTHILLHILLQAAGELSSAHMPHC